MSPMAAETGTSQRRRKIVMITGASSGIGSATALRLAADGHTVVLGARRRERLEKLAAQITDAGGTAMAVPLDVTDVSSVREAVSLAVDRFGRLDVMVNNAGVMPLSPLERGKVDEWDRMIDVNIRGVLHGIAAAQPIMREQRSGHIITVASIGAHEVAPTGAVYSATKYAAWAISEGLRLESEPWMKVSTISPGVTESELPDTITDPETQAFMREYRADLLPASAIAAGISYCVGAGDEVDVNEIILRPSAQRP